jgi:DNA-binding transcriptional MerR regulator
MDKSPDAFRTISEVAEVLDTPAHVLRFWESRFPQIRPVKRAGGRRYYRPSDVALLSGIKRLLHDEGLTIRGVQKILRDQGARHVAALSDDSDAQGSVGAEPAVTDSPAAPMVERDVAPGPEPRVAPPAPPPVAGPRPPRALPDQPPLPLFDSAAARPDPQPAPAARRTLGEARTIASQLRALAPGGLADPAGLAEVAGRLAALRDRLAERAAGGPG